MIAGNIVIVEDEILVAMQLEDILMDGGHQVVATVPDLAGALSVAGCPEVALVDLNLRDGPTGSTIAKLLSERFGTRIIYVTANAAQIGEPAFTAVGVVQKPFSREIIEAAVAYALDATGSLTRPCHLEPLDGPRVLQSA